MSRILDVYFHNIFTGKLLQNKSGSLSFQYDEAYLSQDNPPAISLSLPLQSQTYEGNKVNAYFSGLLPEDIARHRLARYLGISDKNPFALLEAIGGECAGALSLYPEGETPPPESPSDIEKLNDQQLREILDLLKRRPLLAGTDNLRLSLAGAQDKIAVAKKEGTIALVTGTMPTTHILKPIIEDIKDSVHNEIFCMHLAQMMKIEVPKTEIHWLDGTPYFLVERYDRLQGKDQKITRLHQEDFCQALSIMPELKYEREGGPSATQCLALLQNHSLKPAADRLAFIHRLIFNFLIGNADAHAKNHSLLYTGNIPVLAPAYDLLSTTIYPELSYKMAMKIGKKYDPDYVFLRHWQQIVPDTTAARKGLEKDLINLSKICLPNALTLKSTLASEGVVSPIFDDICKIIKIRAGHIQSDFA